MSSIYNIKSNYNGLTNSPDFKKEIAHSNVVQKAPLTASPSFGPGVSGKQVPLHPWNNNQSNHNNQNHNRLKNQAISQSQSHTPLRADNHGIDTRPIATPTNSHPIQPNPNNFAIIPPTLQQLQQLRLQGNNFQVNQSAIQENSLSNNNLLAERRVVEGSDDRQHPNLEKTTSENIVQTSASFQNLVEKSAQFKVVVLRCKDAGIIYMYDTVPFPPFSAPFPPQPTNQTQTPPWKSQDSPNQT